MKNSNRTGAVSQRPLVVSLRLSIVLYAMDFEENIRLREMFARFQIVFQFNFFFFLPSDNDLHCFILFKRDKMRKFKTQLCVII